MSGNGNIGAHLHRDPIDMVRAELALLFIVGLRIMQGSLASFSKGADRRVGESMAFVTELDVSELDNH